MKVEASKPRNKTLKLIWYCFRAASVGLAVCFMLSSPKLQAQEDNGGMKFEVLDVTTGSGSKPKNSGEMPAAELPPGTIALEGESPLSIEPTSDNANTLFTALDRWHNQTLATYNYAIGELQDPFLPIKEVRGKPPAPGGGPGPEEANLPPILRCDLSQLKLVAITILSDRPGGALVSFEDGAGSSYILRQGDRICRYKGRITKIEPSRVIVEEPDRLGPGQPQINEIKLNVLDTSTGVTRESAPDEGPTELEQLYEQVEQPGQT